MRINGTENNNIHLFAGNNSTEDIQNQKNQNQKSNPNTIFVGDTNLNSETATKKENARNRAMKLIMDAYRNDKKIDDGLNEIREHQERLSENLDMANGELNRINESQKQLKEQYEISEDSQEQKDLELLEKYEKNPFSLTEEETERLKNMGPLTDYQRESLELNALKEDWQKVADSSSEGIINANKAISSIKIERSKTHEMVDSQADAEEILEASAKEIAGMILSEAKENIEEEQEEKVEEAKEAEEAKKQEAAKEAEETEDNTTDKLNDDSEERNKLMKDLKQIIDEEKVIEDDIKGLITDALI